MLVRQDTHGTRFDVARFDTRSEAVAAMAEYESGYPHHQTYYVERHGSDSPTGIAVSGRLALRPASDADLETLRRFFSHPGFNEQWGGRALTDDEIAAKYTGRRSPLVECFLVEQDHEPIGFIQYCLDEHGSKGGGIDFVLMPAARGAGIGSLVVRALVHHLTTDQNWQRITVDPDVANQRGVNFWTTVGFVPERIVDGDPSREPYHLMSWPLD